MSRIADRRNKILQYISKYNCDPLLFKDPYTPDSPIIYISDTNIDSLVKGIITLSTTYGSYNPNMQYIETFPGKMRSSLDIWRHAKSVIPDIDIFTVMESIYNIKNQIYGHYCITVKRSVFMPPRYSSGVRNILCREYNIMFSTWRCLHE